MKNNKMNILEKLWIKYIDRFEKTFYSIPTSRFWEDNKYDFIEDILFNFIKKGYTENKILNSMRTSLRHKMIDEYDKLKRRCLENGYAELDENNTSEIDYNDKLNKNFEDMISGLNEKEKEVCRIIGSGVTKNTEIAEEMGVSYQEIRTSIQKIKSFLEKTLLYNI